MNRKNPFEIPTGGSEQFAKMIMGAIIEATGANKEEQPVGQISDGLLKEFKMYRRAMENHREEEQDRIEELAIEARRKLKQEFGDRENELADLKEQLWSRIYTELGVTRDGHYSIDVKTGIITKEIKKEA